MTTTQKRCKDYGCEKNHLLHITVRGVKPLRAVLVGGRRPYLTIRDGEGRYVGAISGAALRKLATIILDKAKGRNR